LKGENVSIALLQKKLKARYPGFQVREEDRCLIVTGHSSDWDEIIAACQLCVSPKKGYHVINDVTFEGAEIPPMRVPDLKDDALEGKTPDVLIIGGGISGCSIARELSRYRLSILLVDKESDVALHASGRTWIYPKAPSSSITWSPPTACTRGSAKSWTSPSAGSDRSSASSIGR
jgi:glycerol-3-phosphate dehydrogenase